MSSQDSGGRLDSGSSTDNPHLLAATPSRAFLPLYLALRPCRLTEPRHPPLRMPVRCGVTPSARGFAARTPAPSRGRSGLIGIEPGDQHRRKPDAPKSIPRHPMPNFPELRVKLGNDFSRFHSLTSRYERNRTSRPFICVSANFFLFSSSGQVGS